MNMLKYLLVVAVVLGFCGPVWAAEPTLEATVAAAKEQAGKAVIDAAKAKEQAVAAAARRASLSFGQARYEDGLLVLGAVKSGVCYIGAGTANADGYIGACVAIPATYLTKKAFSVGASCAAEAAR